MCRKKTLDDRFKNRRTKRAAAPSEDSPAGKKQKDEKNMSEFDACLPFWVQLESKMIDSRMILSCSLG
jgi:hypothetical protein